MVTQRFFILILLGSQTKGQGCRKRQGQVWQGQFSLSH